MIDLFTLWAVFICGIVIGAGTLLFISKRYIWTIIVKKK